MINLKAALPHLRQDPTMADLIEQYPAPVWREAHQIDLFADVVESIISQQLSVKVAEIITARIKTLLPDGRFSPAAILALQPEDLRQRGLSYAKIHYLRSAAEASNSGLVDFANLPELDEATVISELIKIHGVGQWTAEMLLIFSLHRPDIFSMGDLGLRTAVSRLYGVNREDKAAIATLSEQWSPYRSLASRYLWLSLDNS